MSGIYQIYNPINNKRYIGSSINVERRLKEHLRNLEKNRHCNDHLQSAYNKYKDVLQFNNWTDPITQDKIEEYLSYRSKYANRVNPVLRTLYDIRPDKQGFINRMNNLTPIEWAVPLGLPMFFGEEQENK